MRCNREPPPPPGAPTAGAHLSSPLAAKLSRLSLALPPLTLTPFPGPGPRRPPWEGADAGAAGGEAGGAGAPGPAEEDGEDEDEDEEDEEAAGSRGPGRTREAPVPVVVSSADADTARPLRGLLKSPRAADEPEDSELERKRKMVSFHGDVTVYLFDQVRQVAQDRWQQDWREDHFRWLEPRRRRRHMGGAWTWVWMGGPSLSAGIGTRNLCGAMPGLEI